MNKMSAAEKICDLEYNLELVKANLDAIGWILIEKRIINEKKFQKDSDEYLELTKKIDEECEIARNNNYIINYTNIKSNFIKSELQKTSWKSRLYIAELMKIEILASGKTFGLPTGHISNHLEKWYPKQWKTIWMELNLKGYQKDLGRKKKMKEKIDREEKKFRKECDEDLQKERESWKRAGGRM